MTTEETKERAQTKALSKLISIGRELTKLNGELDSPPPFITVELVQTQIESTLKEQEVWKFILNRTQ